MQQDEAAGQGSGLCGSRCGCVGKKEALAAASPGEFVAPAPSNIPSNIFKASSTCAAAICAAQQSACSLLSVPAPLLLGACQEHGLKLAFVRHVATTRISTVLLDTHDTITWPSGTAGQNAS